MEAENHTALSQFLLLGLSDDPKLQPFLFGLFLSMYLVTVLGNLLIILAVSSDTHLHTPMYFFLSNLFLVDICFISTTVPKMLVNIHTQSKDISYIECLTQTYFFTIFMTFSIGTEIPHFFCELAELLKVTISDTFINNLFVYVATALLGVFPVTGILYSYSQIISSLLRMSSVKKKYKAFSTCGSHLCVVSLFCGTALGVYLSSALTHSSQESSIASVLYTVVTPMLNPFIYSLRNKDMKGALGRLLGTASSRP
ncbi:Olfactory receptor 7D4 [Sciurus carolinensis]|uniref:Olfactory receptor 7D4 n=1 Tax=Sciurus carolinensis TaxID=30640 RepID=A0AA41N259_SCICA|nr:Olfactory receptor 7D4 [Sciurus carolinensis]